MLQMFDFCWYLVCCLYMYMVNKNQVSLLLQFVLGLSLHWLDYFAPDTNRVTASGPCCCHNYPSMPAKSALVMGDSPEKKTIPFHSIQYSQSAHIVSAGRETALLLTTASLSVRLSLRHTRDQRLNDSRHRNAIYTTRYSDVSSFLTPFRGREFRGSPRTSGLKRSSHPVESSNLTNNLQLLGNGDR